MTQNLLDVNGSNVTWHSTVGKAIAMFTPWGAAASVVPHIAACGVELRKLKLEADRLKRQHAFASQLIQDRRTSIIRSLKRRSGLPGSSGSIASSSHTAIRARLRVLVIWALIRRSVYTRWRWCPS